SRPPPPAARQGSARRPSFSTARNCSSDPTWASSRSRSPSSVCRSRRSPSGPAAKSCRSACRSSPRPGARILRSESLASSSGTESSAPRLRHSPEETMSESDRSRWAGRNSAKAAVRDRVWSRLVDTEVNVGPAFDRIPNFVGADAAAKRLSELEQWKQARVVKCNPDPPQIPVRLRALYDGKLLFSPVPYLTKGFPYLRIDPDKLAAKGVDFETAATAQGFLEHGEQVGFEDMPRLDFCVVGCVAVGRRGGRTGKGAGFADLEQGVFRELGLVTPATPIATTVHSSQVVDDGDVVMEAHDSALDYIATELELIVTHTPFSQPQGVAWDKVRPDQFADIPFLSALRQSIEMRKRGR